MSSMSKGVWYGENFESASQQWTWWFTDSQFNRMYCVFECVYSFSRCRVGCLNLITFYSNSNLDFGFAGFRRFQSDWNRRSPRSLWCLMRSRAKTIQTPGNGCVRWISRNQTGADCEVTNRHRHIGSEQSLSFLSDDFLIKCKYTCVPIPAAGAPSVPIDKVYLFNLTRFYFQEDLTGFKTMEIQEAQSAYDAVKQIEIPKMTVPSGSRESKFRGKRAASSIRAGIKIWDDPFEFSPLIPEPLLKLTRIEKKVVKLRPTVMNDLEFVEIDDEWSPLLQKPWSIHIRCFSSISSLVYSCLSFV